MGLSPWKQANGPLGASRMSSIGRQSRGPLLAVQRSRERPLLRRAKGCKRGSNAAVEWNACNFIGRYLSGPIPIRTNNPENCGTRAVLRNETRARQSPKPACRLAPRPGLEPGTCGLTVRRAEVEFYCFINCLQRPRNQTVAVECSATQGHTKQRSYIFVYTQSSIKMRAVGRVARNRVNRPWGFFRHGVATGTAITWRPS